jgi:hypothetical protein
MYGLLIILYHGVFALSRKSVSGQTKRFRGSPRPLSASLRRLATSSTPASFALLLSTHVLGSESSFGNRFASKSLSVECILALLDFAGCKGSVCHALPVATQKRSGEPHYPAKSQRPCIFSWRVRYQHKRQSRGRRSALLRVGISTHCVPGEKQVRSCTTCRPQTSRT